MLDPDQPAPLVIVVDDDEGMREALGGLFRSVGLEVLSFVAARAFLDATIPDRPCCLVLDVRLPGENGLDLQSKLNAAGSHIPIIFITGHADVPMSVRAMRSGAINFLAKPFRDQDLLDAVWEALDKHATRRLTDRESDKLRKLAETLTAREREVLSAVNRGLLTKQIAFELGIAEITVKMHRSSAFRKLKATTAADMIHKIRALGL